MTELIVIGALLPVLALVIVPALLIAPVENVRVAPVVDWLLIVKLLVPVTPPLRIVE